MCVRVSYIECQLIDCHGPDSKKGSATVRAANVAVTSKLAIAASRVARAFWFERDAILQEEGDDFFSR